MNADWRLQSTIFAESPRRTRLPRALLASDAEKCLRIGVVRNETCEPTLGLAARFAAYVGIALEWDVGPYDDGLQELDGRGALEGSPTRGSAALDGLVVWVDWRRLNPKGQDLVHQRLEWLRACLDGPIALLAPFPGDSGTWSRLLESWTASMGMVPIPFPLPESVRSLRDPRLVRVSGSDLAGDASLHIARWLGVTFAATIAYPPLKLMAVDLDNTLHEGVLGEDGVDNVVVSGSHHRLGEQLRRLRQAGVLLALVTKNDQRDVERLFGTRDDLALDMGEFIAIEASWRSKPEMVKGIAASIGISPDACALLDDNPGELAATAVNGIWPIASKDPEEARRVLELLPRVSAIDRYAQDRETDLRSHRDRQALVSELDAGDLHASLETCIEVRVDAAVDIDRTADLLARTNQFNCTLRRTSRAALARLLASKQARIATVRVHDRLSDSGVVGALVLDIPGNDSAWNVREFALSCRILGRGLEGALLAAMAQVATGEPYPALDLAIVEGPRNEPARGWAKTAVVNGRVVEWHPADLDLLRACRDRSTGSPP